MRCSRCRKINYDDDDDDDNDDDDDDGHKNTRLTPHI